MKLTSWHMKHILCCVERVIREEELEKMENGSNPLIEASIDIHRTIADDIRSIVKSHPKCITYKES